MCDNDRRLTELQARWDWLHKSYLDLECKRNTLAAENAELRADVERLKDLLGRTDPVRCPACGEIRERSEVICGNCTYRLDGSDMEGGDSSEEASHV